MPVKITHQITGDVSPVLSTEEYEMPEPKPKDVLIQMIAAAVNPADINIIQGKYNRKYDYLGHDGVGKVIKIGSAVQKLKVGDHVIPVVYTGTWRTHLALPEESFIRIPKEINIAEAATLYVNPLSVYTMLKEFVKLKPGDTIMQNGANSACGVVVIQMCKAWGIQTVNVVRDRPDIDQLKLQLKEFGATYVFTEEEIKKTDIFKTGQVDNPVLGLNCVGGNSASNILRHLCDEGVLVTYGGMSLEPVTASTTALVFRNIKLEGFNMTNWYNKPQNFSKLDSVYEEIIEMVLKGKLKAPPHFFVDFFDYKEAVSNTLFKGGKVGKKYILDFRAHV